ncbi:MAG: hypothetical protein OXH52_02300 [Gammaproteobacteria bacterium]|nr:hypothetical protein [Gammaproteobacteria bacterium]
METTEKPSAAHIRERPVKRAPWTFRCHRPEHDVLVDIDAFDQRHAVALAAAHWGIDPDMVRVEGRRRRWLRWIGISTHDARDFLTDRSWWHATKLAALVMAALVAAYLTHLAL